MGRQQMAFSGCTADHFVRLHKKTLHLLLLLLFGLSCSESANDADGNGAAAGEELTLSNCSTDFTDDAPIFFETYFKCVSVTQSGDSSVIEADGLPPHLSYYYGEDHPNFEEFDESRGSEYSPNPNEIKKLDIHLEIPENPVSKDLTITEDLVDGVVGTSSEEYPMSVAGVALDGVALFNPLAAPGDDIEEEKYTFDIYNGHPTQDGAYHYHTTSDGPLEVLDSEGIAEVEAYGIMCDGTLVLGCTELDGSSPAGTDFDAQNGHVHDLKDDAGTVYFENRYHTHICVESFPDYKFTPEIQYYEACVTE